VLGELTAGQLDLASRMPFDVIVGRHNPLALPLAISFDPPKALLTGTFTRQYEGPPASLEASRSAIAATRPARHPPAVGRGSGPAPGSSVHSGKAAAATATASSTSSASRNPAPAICSAAERNAGR
jgi:hypothetical protein